MINQLLGVEPEVLDEGGFKDVDADYWAYADIISAAK